MNRIKVKICGRDPLTRRALEAVMTDAGYTVVQGISEAFFAVADMPLALSELEGCDKRIYLCDSGDALPKGGGEILIKPVLFSDITELADRMCKEQSFESPDIMIDGDCLFCCGERLRLSRLELKLFKYLKEHEGTPVSRTELLENVWNGKASGTNITDVYISYLRTKLKNSFGLSPIKAVRGKGYIFITEKQKAVSV